MPFTLVKGMLIYNGLSILTVVHVTCVLYSKSWYIEIHCINYINKGTDHCQKNVNHLFIIMLFKTCVFSREDILRIMLLFKISCSGEDGTS